ncbi:acyl carrier protein [Streptomyces sp. YU58]|uniref:acyl carrier protein n=1 Tax=Streptomyces sp. SX92 TaxID=3158972 RepID=UPI0027BA7299|nr:acyl carrier protein [Streptomyces coralus]WLW54334.1 acyl carrier protein [Streptomyces coralus]
MPEHPTATTLNPEFEAVLRECLDGLIGPDAQLQESTDLTALGIDSLTVVRMLVTLEETFGVTIPDEIITFEIFSSPGVLWNVLSGLMEEPGEC